MNGATNPPGGFPAQVDIAPTLLRELHIARPATWSGRALQDPGHLPLLYFDEHALTGLIDPKLLLHGEGNTIVYEHDPRVRQELFRGG